MSFERKIRNLCEQIIACNDETEAVVLIRQLQIILHERIEQVRGKLIVLPESDGDNLKRA